jgi:hypothetical protein
MRANAATTEQPEISVFSIGSRNLEQ